MPVKRMKFERKAARAARNAAPNPFLTPSPDPAVTDIMAAGGVPIARGSSDEVPLSPEGQEEARETAAKLAKKGGLNALESSASARAEQTAAPIVGANPQPLPVQENPAIEAWALGGAEGEPQSPLIRDQIRDLIRNNPTQKIPGKGAMTSRPGESFDDWRLRYLPAIRGAMQTLAFDPSKKLGILTHSSGIKLTKAWLAKNAPDDFSVDPEAMDLDKSEGPSNVARLYPDESGNWQLNPVDLDDKKPLQGGIYMIRHAATPWNTDDNGKIDQGMAALAQIAKNTRLLDFKKVNDAARKAVNKGHLTGDEVGAMVDQSLPDAETAAGLPHSDLMGIYAAASPAKRSEYEPLMRDRFSGIKSLSPDAQQILASHLGRIGIGGMGPTTQSQTANS